MKKLVLGLGNELPGDEGPGIQVVRKLKQEIGLKAIPRSRL
jgi:Ni,Fe-hydrogenase maturation factor